MGGGGESKGEMARWLEAGTCGVRGPRQPHWGWLRTDYSHCPFFVLPKCSIKPAMQTNKCLMRIAYFY